MSPHAVLTGTQHPEALAENHYQDLLYHITTTNLLPTTTTHQKREKGKIR